MSSSQQSWLKPGLRFCGSCCVSILCWAAWLALSASLAILIYVLVAKELPVPDFVLRRIETRMAEADLTIRFGRAQLDPTGKILLEDVQIRSRQFSEPLLLARLVYIRRSFWTILAGRPIPDEIRLEGATLQLPAILSPSGAAEPMIRDLSAVLRYDGSKVCHVDQVTGRLGKLKITMVGEIAIPPRSAATPPTMPQEVIGRLLKFGRNLVLKTERFEAFEEPSLNIRFENKKDESTMVWCAFTAESGRRPWGATVDFGQFLATASAKIQGGDQITHVHFATKYVNQPDLFAAKLVEGALNLKISAKGFSIRPQDGWLGAGVVEAEGEQTLTPLVRGDLRKWPLIKGAVIMTIENELIDLRADTDWENKSALISIEGTGRPKAINRILEKYTPRAAPYFVFSDPVRVVADASLALGWHFEKFSGRVWAGQINSRGVEITSARGKIDIEGKNFLAHDAQVELGHNYGHGSYWMNFATSEYRMLLKGELRPQKINGWFGGNWWTDFWNDHFDFSKNLPQGDVDVQGRWKDSSQVEFFGKAVANTAGVWGGTFDQVEATVFLRPFFTHVMDFKGRRAGGSQTLTGSLKRTADPESREMHRLEFDLSGNIDPETYHGMLEGRADDVLSTLQFTAPPQMHAQGQITGSGKDAIASYAFTGHSNGDLRYYGFPIHSLAVSGRVLGADVTLTDIQFSALGGKGAGKAALSGTPEMRRLGFDLYLNNADLPIAIRAIQNYQTSRSSGKPTPSADNDIIKRALGGRIDVALSAQGKPGDLQTFAGTGNAAVNGANLGEVQLFGLLSQVLSGLSFHFSTLKLDSAHTSFRWENERLHFPDMKITGPSAAIDAKGDFYFKNNNLDFTAKFKPFEESRSLFTAAIGIVINPITSILELKLSGPLSKPNWSIDVGSSFPRHEIPLTKDKASEPGSQPLAK